MRKETTKKHRINVIDVIVILLVLVCLISIGSRALLTMDASIPKEYRVYFQIDDIKSSSFAFLNGHEGETVRFKNDGTVLGTLGSDFVCGTAVYTYTENMEDGTSEKKHAFYPGHESNDLYSSDRCSITGYIVVKGKQINGKLLVNDEVFIAPNLTLDVITEYIETSLRITNIVEK